MSDQQHVQSASAAAALRRVWWCAAIRSAGTAGLASNRFVGAGAAALAGCLAGWRPATRLQHQRSSPAVRLRHRCKISWHWLINTNFLRSSTVRKKIKCSVDSEIQHGLVNDTTRISPCFPIFVKYHELQYIYFLSNNVGTRQHRHATTLPRQRDHVTVCNIKFRGRKKNRPLRKKIRISGRTNFFEQFGLVVPSPNFACPALKFCIGKL